MKVNCLQETLKRALDLASKIPDPRSPQPMAAHVLLRTEEQSLGLDVTNPQATLTTWMAAEASNRGSSPSPSRF